MPVADIPRPTTASTTPPPPTPAARWSLPVVGPAPRSDGLGRTTGRVLAVAFAVAWVACPLIEPTPAHDMAYPLWQLPIELASFGSIVAAVIALWRGSRHSARLALGAGVLMAVMTVVCPIAGHTPVGWWTWVQTGLSLLVMSTAAALHRRRPAAA